MVVLKCSQILGCFQRQSLILFPLNAGWTQWLPSDEQSVAEMTVDPKAKCKEKVLLPLFWISCLGGSKLPWARSSNLCRNPTRGELEPAVDSQPQLASNPSQLPGKPILWPQESLGMPQVRPTSCLQTHGRSWARSAQSIHPPIYDPQKLWALSIVYYYFMPLNLG